MIVQGDPFNASCLATVVVVPLRSNLRLAAAPGNVRLDATRTGLPKDSVANVSQIVTVDRTVLSERVGRLTDEEVALILGGIEQARGVHGRPLDQLRAAELELRVRERVLEIDQENAGRSPGSMLPCP